MSIEWPNNFPTLEELEALPLWELENLLAEINIRLEFERICPWVIWVNSDDERLRAYLWRHSQHQLKKAIDSLWIHTVSLTDEQRQKLLWLLVWEEEKVPLVKWDEITPPFPTIAPELRKNRDKSLKETPIDFIKRVYAPWIGKRGFRRVVFGKLDPVFNTQISKWWGAPVEILELFDNEEKEIEIDRNKALQMIMKKKEYDRERMRRMRTKKKEEVNSHAIWKKEEIPVVEWSEIIPPFPTVAPELWRNRDKSLKETPVTFITRVYAPWIGRGLQRGILRHFDADLYTALYNWARRSGNEIPEDLVPRTYKHRGDVDVLPEEVEIYKKVNAVRLRRYK